MTSTTLPPPTGPSQAYWDISILDTGHLTLPLRILIDPLPAPTPSNPNPNHYPLTPSLAFFLRHSHSPTGTPTLFDLSISPSAASPTANDGPLSPLALEGIKALFSPLHIPLTVPDALTKGGVHTDDIEHVFLSHLHWDHIGDPRWFKRADFIVGEGARSLLDTGYPHDPNSEFKADLLPRDRTTFLSSEKWEPLGPFPNAHDFFGDGSLYVIDAAGHLPGHINVLARIAPTPESPNNWVYLAGDSAHHCHLLTGQAKIAMTRDPSTGDVIDCWHADPKNAEEQIERMKQLAKMDGVDGVGVKVMLAHDGEWYEKNKGGPMFWPGKL